jgi:hypothetical protein
MILLSTTIYTPPPALPTTTNLPLEHLTHSLERRLVLSLLCSLLNTSLTPSKVNSGVTGQIPYNYLISKAAEERRTLVRASMMTLLVALDYRKVQPQSGSQGEMGEGKDENAFRYFVSKVASLSSGVSNRILTGSIEKKTLHLSYRVSLGFWRNILRSSMVIYPEARNRFHTF